MPTSRLALAEADTPSVEYDALSLPAREFAEQEFSQPDNDRESNDYTFEQVVAEAIVAKRLIGAYRRYMQMGCPVVEHVYVPSRRHGRAKGAQPRRVRGSRRCSASGSSEPGEPSSSGTECSLPVGGPCSCLPAGARGWS